MKYTPNPLNTNSSSSSSPLLTNHQNPNPNLVFYEPTSVLDPHATSSPAVAASGGTRHLPQPPAAGLPDDWDPVSTFLLSSDDPVLFVDPNAGGDLPIDAANIAAAGADPVRAYLDPLLRAAGAIESNNLAAAQSALWRLDHLLQSPSGVPLRRAAFHFKDALASLLGQSTPPPSPPRSAAELVSKINAQRVFTELSPIPQFASFTANQALLEALDTAAAAAASFHIIDFDLGLGGQWSSFVEEVADRRGTRTAVIRLTAVVGNDETAEAALAAENLQDFAGGLGLRFSIDVASSLSGIHVALREPTCVVLSSASLRRFGSEPDATGLLRFIRNAAARLVVFVDTEGGGVVCQLGSLAQSVAGWVEHNVMVMEAVEAAAAAAGAGEEVVARVEAGVIRPRAFAAVRTWWARPEPVKELARRAGWTPARLSEFAVAQAEWLVRRALVDGYHVARRDGTLVLTWNGWELASTSVWRC